MKSNPKLTKMHSIDDYPTVNESIYKIQTKGSDFWEKEEKACLVSLTKWTKVKKSNEKYERVKKYAKKYDEKKDLNFKNKLLNSARQKAENYKGKSFNRFNRIFLF